MFMWGTDPIHGSSGYNFTPEYWNYLNSLDEIDRVGELSSLRDTMRHYSFKFREYNVPFPSLDDLRDMYNNVSTILPIGLPGEAKVRRRRRFILPINPRNHPNHQWF